MKKIIVIVGVLFVVIAGIAIYKAATFFQFQSNVVEQVNTVQDDLTKKAQEKVDTLVQSGKQMMSSGVDAIVAS
jgi:uncharacterized membrane protein YvbJ